MGGLQPPTPCRQILGNNPLETTPRGQPPPTEYTPGGNPLPPRLGVLTLTDPRGGELSKNWN